MKILLSILAALAVLFAAGNLTAKSEKTPQSQASPRSQAGAVTGKVVQTMDSGGYTYALLEKDGQTMWYAVPQMKLKVGQKVTFLDGAMMVDYESKTLKKKFDKVIFSPGPAPSATAARTQAEPVQEIKSEKAKITGKIKVDPATGPNAYTVAGIYEKQKTLNGKFVIVRGKAVKVTVGIMGMTWIHIQDGTGKPGKNDLMVTTKERPAAGDIVTISGILHTNKDFGGGYKYEVIVEDAAVKK